MATFYARRGNKILKVSEDYIDRYLGQGYTITDMNGNLVKKGVPHDTTALTAEVEKQNAEIASLKSELETKDATISKLNDEVASLKTTLKSTKAELDKFKLMPISAKADEPASEPKTTRKRKQATTEPTEE